MAVVQVRNPELREILRADFQGRYEPNFAWKSAASCLLALPMLRGAWVGSVASGGNWHDISGHGNHLSYQGDPEHNYDGLVPYWDLDGTGDYFNITDAASGNDFDVSGTETYVAAAARGLTWGGWFYPRETGTNEKLMAKAGGAPARAYKLILRDTDVFETRFSDDGTNEDAVQSAAVSMNAWYFVVGRVIPASSVDLFIGSLTGLVEYNNATARTPIFDTAIDFEIGSYSGGLWPFNGRVAFCFLCAAALSDAIISSVFQQQRAAFGV